MRGLRFNEPIPCGLREVPGIKDYGKRKIRTVFGSVGVRDPRIMNWQRCLPHFCSAQTVLSDICPYQAPPELMDRSARLGNLLPYRKAAEVIAEFLPIQLTEFFVTLRHRTLKAREREYSSTFHYLRCAETADVEKAKASGGAVVEAMKATPTDDDCFGKGSIRIDGRKFHPPYLSQAKAPEESKSLGDIHNLLATVPAEKAFRPLSEGQCPLVRP
jgi:hypothetical protein